MRKLRAEAITHDCMLQLLENRDPVAKHSALNVRTPATINQMMKYKTSLQVLLFRTCQRNLSDLTARIILYNNEEQKTTSSSIVCGDILYLVYVK
jgi:hypothetical protein